MLNVNPQTSGRTYLWLALLAIVAVVIKVITFFPGWIEHVYLPKIYLPVASIMRFSFGGIPFSLGDIFYAFLIGMVLLKVYRLFRAIFEKRVRRIDVKGNLIKAVSVVLAVYVYFNISWGLNYNRLGIAYQLKLVTKKYSRSDLYMISTDLLQKVNTLRPPIKDSIIRLPSYQEVFNKSIAAYTNTSRQLDFLTYKRPSLKKSNYGRLGNYLGFLGYYNPFTGEAQVNLTIPQMIIPVVTCHEIAHQLGYASESEANFVGYLAAVRSNDLLFHYSAYFDMFLYANNELARMDSMQAKKNFALLNSKVKGDYMQLRDYRRKSRNFLEPLIESFYDFYLKANQQAKGVESYNEVVGWLIAYKKKYGAI